MSCTSDLLPAVDNIQNDIDKKDKEHLKIVLSISAASESHRADAICELVAYQTLIGEAE
jgi:hypothetical protein